MDIGERKRQEIRASYLANSLTAPAYMQGVEDGKDEELKDLAERIREITVNTTDCRHALRLIGELVGGQLTASLTKGDPRWTL